MVRQRSKSARMKGRFPHGVYRCSANIIGHSISGNGGFRGGGDEGRATFQNIDYQSNMGAIYWDPGKGQRGTTVFGLFMDSEIVLPSHKKGTT